MNIFTIFFLQNFSKIFSKTHQFHHFFKFSRGSMPPNPPSKRVVSPRAALRLFIYKLNNVGERQPHCFTPLLIPHTLDNVLFHRT